MNRGGSLECGPGEAGGNNPLASLCESHPDKSLSTRLGRGTDCARPRFAAAIPSKMACSSTATTSLALGRVLGLALRHAWMSCSTSGGALEGLGERGYRVFVAVVFRHHTHHITYSGGVMAPRTGCCPVQISHNTTPNEKISCVCCA